MSQSTATDIDARDRAAIREVVACWAIARDTGDWERLRTTWHPGGIMNATWFQGSVDEFIERARTSFARGNMSSHILGGTAVELGPARPGGRRAIAQTRMTIASRETIDGVLYDIACIGRFYDFFEERAGHWAIVERQPTYEKDRADPVIPGRTVEFDLTLLDSFPPGYRFLAYAQSKRGLVVKRDMPGVRGPEIEALYARGRAWLAGA